MDSKHSETAVRRIQSKLDDGDSMERSEIPHSGQGKPGLTFSIEFQDPVAFVFIAVLPSWVLVETL